jgi:hypothetical protein
MGQKIFSIDGGIMFCSGRVDLVESAVDFVRKFGHSDSFFEFCRKTFVRKDDDIYDIEIIIVDSASKNIIQISQYNDFNPVSYTSSHNGIRIITGGIHTKECADLSESFLMSGRDLVDIYRDVYDELSSSEIGGTLSIWEVSDSCKKIYENPITEKDVKYPHSIVADAVIGRLIAGNDLLITNDNSSFTVSGSLATLTNAILTISNANTQITLDPTDGIAISKITDGNLEKKFYTDTNGNVIFAGHLAAASGCFVGEITAASGKIGSWTIDDRGLKDDYGNYIYGDGNVRLGKLTITGDSATFDGTFYAHNLHPSTQFTGAQLRNINADTITAGTIRGINIFGSRIYWGHTEMYELNTGKAIIRTDDAISIGTNKGEVSILENGISISHNSVFIGDWDPGGIIKLRAGALYMNGNQGVTGTFLV